MPSYASYSSGAIRARIGERELYYCGRVQRLVAVKLPEEGFRVEDCTGTTARRLNKLLDDHNKDKWRDWTIVPEGIVELVAETGKRPKELGLRL